ncbi:MAG TPA: tRNA (adenosine(37)-N6)-dimethylallyltransferase MiaA [Actinomycetota bacterium]|nr:tRNA (adenosine(37)-N6)-dimethylallyltransferase MiaA [Actinomycetota bacterium]
MGAPLLALVGPTAAGKSEAAVRLAEALDAEVVSVDSTTVYRGVDAGTAKPTPEQRARVPHHLLDVAEPGEAFSVARFQRLAREAVSSIRARGRTPLLVGGSGLYYRAVVDGLEFPGTSPLLRGLLEAEALVLGPEALHRRLQEADPEAARRIDPRNVRRTVRALEVMALTGRPFSSFARAWDRYPPEAVVAAGVDLPRPVLYRRIEERARRQHPGILDETRRLVAAGLAPFVRTSRIIGYAEALGVLEGVMTEEEALVETVRRTKALVRHQLAWFRRDPRVRWFRAGEEGAVGIVDELLAYLGRSVPAGAGRGGR